MQSKKIKHLDQFRPNVLPQLSRTMPEKSSVSSFMRTELEETLQREKLLELLSETERGAVTERPDILKLMEKKRLDELAHRTKRQKDMFVLDGSTDIFALPGKPEQAGLLSPEHRRSKGRLIRKSKAIDIVNDGSPDLKQKGGEAGGDDFSFLNESLGITRAVVTNTDFESDNEMNVSMTSMGLGTAITSPTKIPQGQVQRVAPGGSNNTSDLDQIAGIMEGIVTGGDALNFFARFGSETPVKFIHLVLAEDPKNYR